jgi:hypothetical protein
MSRFIADRLNLIRSALKIAEPNGASLGFHDMSSDLGQPL